MRLLDKLPPGNSLSQQEYALIESGDMPKCAVAEVESIWHPVRHCTLPGVPARALVATSDLKEGEPLGVYVGEYWFNEQRFDRQHDAEEQMYAYALEGAQLEEECPLSGNQRYDGKPAAWPSAIIVNAQDQGNIARFMSAPYECDGGEEEINVEARAIFDDRVGKKRPYVMIYAMCDISKGDEIMVDYGKAYWRKVTKYMQNAHAAFYEDTHRTCKRIKHQLAAAGVGQMDIERCAVPVDLEGSNKGLVPTDLDALVFRAAAAETHEAHKAAVLVAWPHRLATDDTDDAAVLVPWSHRLAVTAATGHAVGKCALMLQTLGLRERGEGSLTVCSLAVSV
ncbi:hypothetical protein WJX72_000836 [[Myrmecia] bisecta]|uniref:SET domain-containing protein n=1 Tax=[Myrmecia] bisecta TaxID=41462 RepID=A0AAW1PJA2_9CHLO